MRKATLKETNAVGWLTAASLAVTLAMFGCTSNQYAGNGQPTRVTPTMDTVNHSMTYGSSSGTEGTPPPMASSYTAPAAPSVNVDALAVLAADRGFRGYVLGPVNPGGVQQGVAVSSGQFESPANAVLPQSTVNSSINSQPVPAITGGDIGVATGTTVAAASSPIPTLTTGGAATTTTTTPTPTAATSALTASTGAPTVAGSAAFSPILMNSTPAPQATGTTGPTLRTVVATGSVVTGNRAAATNTTAQTSAARTTASTAAARGVSGIQLQTNSSGSITMTNVAAPAVKGGVVNK